MHRFFLPSFVGYKKQYLSRDLLAGLIVTAIAVPESLAFAVIIGLPVQMGLYSALLAPIIFALFTTSRRLVIGADSATAVLLAGGAGSLAVMGTADYVSVVSAISLIAGIIVVLFGVLKFGFLSDLISKPVLIGFIAGVGVQLMLGKMPEIIGMQIDGSLIHKVTELVNDGFIHLPSLLTAMTVLLVMLLAGRSKLPSALMGLLSALALGYALDLQSAGVATIGSITEGLPGLVMPSWSLENILAILPISLSIALVIQAQSSATARTIASRHEEVVDDNKDLIALGFANITSVFSQGFSVNGSPPRSYASEMSGGKSQMVNVFMSLMIGLILLFAVGTLEMIPVPALAMLIFVVGFSLIDFGRLKDIFLTNKTEFFIAMSALLGTVLLGVMQGLFIAIIVSLTERLRREYRPTDRVLLKDRSIDAWALDRLDAHHRFTSRPAGLIVYRFDGAIFFENSEYFTKRLMETVQSAHEPVHGVIIDAGSISDIDYTGAEALKHCYKLLRTDDIRLSLAHVSPTLHKLLDKYGVVKLLTSKRIFATLNEAVRSQPTSKRSTVEMVKLLNLPKNEVIVIGGGVLDALNIRDTNDVDIVVSSKVYNMLSKKNWSEYVQDDGKKVLSHNGYKVMQRWIGNDLKYYKKHAFEIDGVLFASLEDVASAKKKLGRSKDMKDVRLIEKYLKSEKHPNHKQ